MEDYVKTQREDGLCKPGGEALGEANPNLILELTSRLWENKILIFKATQCQVLCYGSKLKIDFESRQWGAALTNT